jgi:carbon-monoxide dehydrogenase iron sulfur subunit
MQVLKQSTENERKFVAADLEKCTGCGVCELICALKRENVYNPRCSRIKILRLYRLINMAVVCRLCENTPCIIACPQDCLTQSEKTGVIMVDEEKCDCCGWCIEACPYGAITLNPEKETVMMCDLCDGDPQCVEWCPEGALDLVTQKEFDKNLRKITVNKLIKENLRLGEDAHDLPTTENEEGKETDVLRQLSEIDKMKKSLNLLLEAFSEPNPIEILIYGMFVKKNLASLVPKSRAKIEKTLKWLDEIIKLAEKKAFTQASTASCSAG